MFCGQHLEIRITPAWAGKSTCRASMPTVSWDHPRVGGEKKGVRHWWALPRGSPPRWRGKATFSGRSDPGVGITPAWAGKSRSGVTMDLISRDHPRVGGEKQIGGDNGLDKQGSPPRGRGKVDSLSRQLTGSGITPAWAGKSKEPLKICEKQEDHPRVGGEKLDLLAVVFSALGSPPRGRGKDVDWLGFNQFFRITPAWAGKSHLGVFCREPHRDHPRVGGEKRDTESREDSILGSPPRGRGKDLP